MSADTALRSENDEPTIIKQYRNKKYKVAGFEIVKPERKPETTSLTDLPDRQKYTAETGHMAVQPLRTAEEIEKAKEYFLNKPERYKGQNIRDWCIFIFGINLARRAGDLLHLRVHNVLNSDGTVREKICIKEQKTGKSAIMIVTPTIKDALELYLSGKKNINPSEPLFPSRVKDKAGNYKAMTVTNFYLKMQGLKEELDLSVPLGTHSMRKTWAYQLLKNNPDNPNIMVAASKVLNHSSVAVTMRYIGQYQEEIDETLMKSQL